MYIKSLTSDTQTPLGLEAELLEFAALVEPRPVRVNQEQRHAVG